MHPLFDLLELDCKCQQSADKPRDDMLVEKHCMPIAY